MPWGFKSLGSLVLVCCSLHHFGEVHLWTVQERCNVEQQLDTISASFSQAWWNVNWSSMRNSWFSGKNHYSVPIPIFWSSSLFMCTITWVTIHCEAFVYSLSHYKLPLLSWMFPVRLLLGCTFYTSCSSISQFLQFDFTILTNFHELHVT